MKTIIIAATALALSSSMALADQPAANADNGAGGQAVKAANEILKAEGTNLGQAIKTARDAGGEVKLGKEVSAINQDANHN
jgi:hypothetical protein